MAFTYVVEVDPLTACAYVTVTSDVAIPAGTWVQIWRVNEDDATATKVRGGLYSSFGLEQDIADCETPIDGTSFGYCAVAWTHDSVLTYQQLLDQNTSYNAVTKKYAAYEAFHVQEEAPLPSPVVPCSAIVSVDSDCPVWFKDPFNPERNMGLCCVTAITPRTYTGNSSTVRPLTRSKQVAIWDVRTAGTYAIYFITKSETDSDRIRTLIMDGGPLMVQSTDEWHSLNEWVSVGDVSEGALNDKAYTRAERRWTMNLTVIDSPLYEVEAP